MPLHFDRFRFLNGGREVRNESEHLLYLRAEEAEDPLVLAPGEEGPVPRSPAGETIVDVLSNEPE